MIIKSGIDLVELWRIQQQADNTQFISRVFHPSELRDADVRRLSSVFALKEAAFKALGLSSDHWLDVEIRYDNHGKPSLLLSDTVKPKQRYSLDCSVSHTPDLTVAIVILLQDEH